MIARFATLLVVSLALTACGETGPHPDFTGPPSPALYELASADGTVEGWLFGTIHSLPDGVEWQTPKFEQALNKADVLLVEVRDLDNRHHMQDLFAERAYTLGEPPLIGKVPQPHRAQLLALLAENGANISDFADMETWSAALTIAELAGETDIENGVEQYLLDSVSGDRTLEIEGAERQLDIFDTLPEKEQRDLLLAILADIENGRDDPFATARKWYSGKIGDLASPEESALLADSELREALLIRRNRAWADILQGMLEKQPRPFVAVGAAHVSGPDGLPALLEQRGYAVTRIQ